MTGSNSSIIDCNDIFPLWFKIFYREIIVDGRRALSSSINYRKISLKIRQQLFLELPQLAARGLIGKKLEIAASFKPFPHICCLFLRQFSHISQQIWFWNLVLFKGGRCSSAKANSCSSKLGKLMWSFSFSNYLHRKHVAKLFRKSQVLADFWPDMVFLWFLQVFSIFCGFGGYF